jgi:hypothetical protein
MQKVIFILILTLCSQGVFSQGTVFEEKRTVYKNEQSFGLVIHTRGWGVNYRYGKYTTGFSRRIYELEFVGIKHSKHIKSFKNPFDNSNGFVYGQLNSIMVLRAGIGSHKTFVSKQSVRGIAISSVFNVGISLVYAKPSYIEVVGDLDIDNSLLVEIEKYDPNKHDYGSILGGTSLFHGFFTGTFYPGIYIKTALNFETSRKASKIKALEVGAILDLYYKKIPMMANDFNKMYFFNLYVSLNFGTKKTE